MIVVLVAFSKVIGLVKFSKMLLQHFKHSSRSSSRERERDRQTDRETERDRAFIALPPE